MNVSEGCDLRVVQSKNSPRARQVGRAIRACIERVIAEDPAMRHVTDILGVDATKLQVPEWLRTKAKMVGDEILRTLNWERSSAKMASPTQWDADVVAAYAAWFWGQDREFGSLLRSSCPVGGRDACEDKCVFFPVVESAARKSEGLVHVLTADEPCSNNTAVEECPRLAGEEID